MLERHKLQVNIHYTQTHTFRINFCSMLFFFFFLVFNEYKWNKLSFESLCFMERTREKRHCQTKNIEIKRKCKICYVPRWTGGWWLHKVCLVDSICVCMCVCVASGERMIETEREREYFEAIYCALNVRGKLTSMVLK